MLKCDTITMTAEQDEPSVQAGEARKALERFVVENDDLLDLESRIGRFNIFDALGITRVEIRHSWKKTLVGRCSTAQASTLISYRKPGWNGYCHLESKTTTRSALISGRGTQTSLTLFSLARWKIL